jgi:hypothetical protein
VQKFARGRNKGHNQIKSQHKVVPLAHKFAAHICISSSFHPFPATLAKQSGANMMMYNRQHQYKRVLFSIVAFL